MKHLQIVRPSEPAERKTRTTVDTIEVTPALVRSWLVPPFQRPLVINRKVREVGEQIKADGGVIPGVITLGIVEGLVYKVDGQHRLYAFSDLSGCERGYADVRQLHTDSMAALAREFSTENASLVKLRSDDRLRAEEFLSESILWLHKRCPFIGYDQVRRSASRGPVLNMGLFLRAWGGSRGDTPVATLPVATAVTMLEGSTDEAQNAANFALFCFQAWGRDLEHQRLWAGANLALCAWVYRRLVLREGTTGASRHTVYTPEDFAHGLMALAASSTYREFLVGRTLKDRSPIYTRLRTVLARRYQEEHGKKALYPQPTWARQ